MVYVLIALLGSTISAVGVVFQKKGLEWVAFIKTKKQQPFYTHLSTWIFGIFLTYVLSAIPVSLASKELPPHIITAMSGWGIVIVIALSHMILKEKIYFSDFIYSLLILGSILVIGFLSKKVSKLEVDRGTLNILFLIPFTILFPIPFKKISNKVKSALLAIFAGSMGSLAIIFFNLLVRRIFIYGIKGIQIDFTILYLFTAVSGAIAEQIAFRIGQMTVVESIRISLFILYPVFCSIFLYSALVDYWQLIAIVIIIISCYGIFRKR